VTAPPPSRAVAEYEQGAATARALLADALTIEHLDAMEAADEDAPRHAVAERLAALADWQDRIGRLDAADGTGALRPYLDAEQAACAAAHARINDVFVRWFFGGWAALPAAAHTGEATR